MKKGYSRLRIKGVSVRGGEPIVVLEERDRGRGMTLPVSPYEAGALLLELEGVPSPRPLSYDLLAFFFTEGGFSLEEVELFGEPGPGSRAKIEYRRGLRRYEKEVRPADALVLALRLAAPVAAESSLLRRAGRDSPAWEGPRIIPFEDWKARA